MVSSHHGRMDLVDQHVGKGALGAELHATEQALAWRWMTGPARLADCVETDHHEGEDGKLASSITSSYNLLEWWLPQIEQSQVYCTDYNLKHILALCGR